MKVLHVASEFYPLIKTGGLADVMGALPTAEQRSGMDVRVVLPYYPVVREALPEAGVIAARDTFAGHIVFRYVEYEGIGMYLLDAPHLYDRPGNPYHDDHYSDYHDNVYRFAVLGWAAAALATGLDEHWGAADVLHAHDWQAGLAPAYLKHWGSQVRSVFTIHNIAYQGMFSSHHLPEVWLPWDYYQVEGLEFRGQLSFLKAGLYYADQITTVSPTYADEITQEPSGRGFEGLLQTRYAQGRLRGILNGVDESVWDPKTDPHLKKNYHLRAMQGKRVNKEVLQKAFNLPQDENALLVVMVSRLVEQKGADLLIGAVRELLSGQEKPPIQFAILGTGAPELEHEIQELSRSCPDNVAVKIAYDESLSHQMIGGGDAIVVPSRFEPCGLTQLYGLRYGTLPIVRHTGGLADTVTDTTVDSLKDKTATGFVFVEPQVNELKACFENALEYWQKVRQWAMIRSNALHQPVGWELAAEHYASCYQR